jgi:glyoxylate/hydroxypyruvate reductase A
MPSALVYISPEDPAERWRDALVPVLPEVNFTNDFHVWPDCKDTQYDPEDVDIALVWRPKPGDLKHFPNLKAVINLGAGVDTILADVTYPKGVPLVRLVDPALTRHMSEFIVHRVLHFHRKFHV